MKHDVRIVTFAGHHEAGVVELWKSVFGYESPQNEPTLSIAKKVAVSDGLFFVAEVDGDGRVVGSVMGGYDGHRGWIYSLAVHSEWRERSVGTALMQQIENALIELGCMKINLQVMENNAGAESFYQKLGYVNEPRISMGKQIPQNINMPQI